MKGALATAQWPRPPERFAGLSRLPYRLGTQRDFLTALCAQLDASDATTLALLDAWAVVADVTTFYQEALANEQYVRTATEPRSLLELSRLVGSKPRPGLAASVHLALTVAKERSVTVERLTAQSVPGPGEVPQTFESSERLEARASLNALPLCRTRPLELEPEAVSELDIRTATPPAACDPLLLQLGNEAPPTLFRITAVDELGPQRYRIGVTRWGASEVAARPNAAFRPRAYLLRSRASLFGSAAPRVAHFETGEATVSSWLEPQLEEEDAARDALYLDGVYEGIASDSYVVIDSPLSKSTGADRPRSTVVRRARAVSVRGRAAYGLSQRVTRIELSDSRPEPDEAEAFALHREVVVFARCEEVELLDPELKEPAGGSELMLDVALDFPLDRNVIVVDPVRPEEAELAKVVARRTVAGRTLLVLQKPLTHTFARQRALVYGNVVRATHGQTQGTPEPEVIGSASAVVPAQRLTLPHAPLTYLPSEGGGVAPALEVWVDGMPWTAVESMSELGADARAYVVSVDESGKGTLTFGDGRHGARPPTGVENVRARYRVGLGTSGNVRRNQVSLLLERPLGVEAVTNPLPASGGVDPDVDAPELLRDTTQRANRADRLVSVGDYSARARLYPGVEKAHARRKVVDGRDGVELTLAMAGDERVGAHDERHAALLRELHELGSARQTLWIRVAQRIRARMQAEVVLERGVRQVEAERALRARIHEDFGFRRRRLAEPLYPSALLNAMLQVPGVIHAHLRALDPPPPSQAEHGNDPTLVYFDPELHGSVVLEVMQP